MILHARKEGSGKPLIILHGFLGMSDNWKTLSMRYAEIGFETHSLDLRNHGRSFHSDEFSYELMAEDIFNYCNALDLAEADIIGHSMGGKVAMLFAVAHPEKVRKLIVADIGPRYYKPHHDEIIAALNAVDKANVKSREQADRIMSEYIPDQGTRQFLLKSLYRKDADNFAFRFNLESFNRNIGIIGDPLPESSRFEKPSLFISGEQSRYVKEEDHPEILNHFPKAEFYIVKNAGHWLHAENPDEFLTATVQFLNK